MDQALLTFHNQLNEEVQVFYTTDFCYKVKRFLRLQDTARKIHSLIQTTNAARMLRTETEDAEHLLKAKIKNKTSVKRNKKC